MAVRVLASGGNGKRRDAEEDASGVTNADVGVDNVNIENGDLHFDGDIRYERAKVMETPILGAKSETRAFGT